MFDIFDEISLEGSPQGDIFDQIEYTPSSLEKNKSIRHITRTASRIGESLLGLPSDFLQTAQLGARGLEKGASAIREKIGLQPLDSQLKKEPSIGSEDLKRYSEKIFGDIVKPQSEGEKLLDNIVSDAAVLAIPFKGKIPFIRSIGTALAANLAEKGAEKLGLGEKGQIATKLGTFFLSGLTGKGNVKKFWNEQYKLADKSIPSKARFNASNLDRKLDKLSVNLSKGGIETPSQRFITKPLEEIQSVIHNGEMRVEDAIAAKRKINELRSSLFDEVKGKNARKFARTKINDVAKYLDEALENYGKENPTFYKHYKAANEAYGGFQQSKRVGRWINRAIPLGKMGKTGLLILESLFKPTTLPYTVGGFTAIKSGELLTRMFKNPTLRRYYSGLMKSAINENKTGLIRNLRGIEKEMQKNPEDWEEFLTRKQNANK